MLGNDVVDLRDADAGEAETPRFDARVFCEAERCALAASADRRRLRWVLWAAKEAAYKAAVRQDAATIFSPARFEVALDEDAGFVTTPVGRLRVRVTEEDGAVHAVIGDPRRSLVGMTRVGIHDADPDAPGREARRFARERIARSVSAAPEDVEIRKRGRLPELWIADRPAGALSLSHHGGVVGFAFERSAAEATL